MLKDITDGSGRIVWSFIEPSSREVYICHNGNKDEPVGRIEKRKGGRYWFAYIQLVDRDDSDLTGEVPLDELCEIKSRHIWPKDAVKHFIEFHKNRPHGFLLTSDRNYEEIRNKWREETGEQKADS